MFRLVTGDIDTEQPELADAVYRFRHRFFVDHLGWEACRKPDGRERDQFDGPDCVHLVCAQQGEVVSYARFLPTTRPHLLSHVYPEILQGASAPTGPGIYEWTRQAIAPRMRETVEGRAFTLAMSGAIAQAVEAMGLDGLLVQTHPVLVERLMALGWDVEPLALPCTYDRGLLLPIYARPTADTLAIGRAACAAHGLGLDLPPRHLPLTDPAKERRLVA